MSVCIPLYEYNKYRIDTRVYLQLWSISVSVSTAASSALSNPASDARALTATFNAFRQETALASDSNDILKDLKRNEKSLWSRHLFIYKNAEPDVNLLCAEDSVCIDNTCNQLALFTFVSFHCKIRKGLNILTF